MLFDKRELAHEGTDVPLSAKEFAVLEMLCRSHAAPVSKGELIRSVWSNEPASDAALTQTVYRLRRILGRYEPGIKYITTIGGRGYRFKDPLRSDARPSLHDHGSQAATEYYHRAMYELKRTTYEAVRKSIALFDEALKADPNYVPALIGLAQATQAGALILSIEFAPVNRMVDKPNVA